MTDETENNEIEQPTQEEMDARMDNGPTELESLKTIAKQYGITHSPNIGVDTLRAKIEEHKEALEAENKPKDEDETSAFDAPDEETVVATATPPEPTPEPPQLSEEEVAAAAAQFKPAPASMEGKAPAQTAPVNLTNVATEAPVNRRAMTHRSRDPRMPTDGQMKNMTQDEIAALPPTIRTRVIRWRQRKECMKLIRCQIYNNNPAKNDLKGEIFSVGNKYVGTVRKFIPYGDVTENGYHVPKILVDMLRSKKYQRVRSVRNNDGTERVESTLAPEFTITELEPLTPDQLKELAARQGARDGAMGFMGGA